MTNLQKNLAELNFEVAKLVVTSERILSHQEKAEKKFSDLNNKIDDLRDRISEVKDEMRERDKKVNLKLATWTGMMVGGTGIITILLNIFGHG